MPKTHRELVRRQIAHAYHNLELSHSYVTGEDEHTPDELDNQLELALDHLSKAEQEFTAQHPELGEMLQVVIVIVSEAREIAKAHPLELDSEYAIGFEVALGLLEKFVGKVWERDTFPWDSWRNVPE